MVISESQVIIMLLMVVSAIGMAAYIDWRNFVAYEALVEHVLYYNHELDEHDLMFGLLKDEKRKCDSRFYIVGLRINVVATPYKTLSTIESFLNGELTRYDLQRMSK